MIRNILGLLCFFFINTYCLAQEAYENVGTVSNLFLRLGTNARVSGLAESFTGLADDENTLFYNPAGLSSLKMGAVSLNHTEWFEDIRIDNITFAYQFNRQFGIGAGLSHLWMPAIQGRDYLGQETEAINVSSSVLQMGLAYKFLSGFNAGIGIKYFIDKLHNFSANGFGFDVGFHFQTFLPGFSIGIAAQNIGAEVTYYEEKQKIPLTYRGGIAYNFFNPSLIITADVVKSIDSDYAVQSGIEYVFQEAFSLRVGSRYAINGIFTPTFGAGFHLQNHYNLYYTFVNYSDLGGTHRVGFTFQFNTPATKRWKRSLQLPGVPLELRPPQYVNARVKENELILTWEYVRGATYNVYARHSSQTEWKKINKIPITSSMLKFKKPTLKGDFYFRVTSIMNNKESMHSKETSLHVE